MGAEVNIVAPRIRNVMVDDSAREGVAVFIRSTFRSTFGEETNVVALLRHYDCKLDSEFCIGTV